MENINIVINKQTRMIQDLPRAIIGNDGENLQENLVFSFDDEFVQGQARLEIIMPDKTKTWFSLTQVEETYQLPVKSILTKIGKIYMQLVIDEGTDENSVPIFKSNIFYVICNKSINAPGEEPPEGYQSWLEIANAKLNLIDEKLEDVDDAITEANNLDLDVSKEGKIATVTLTKKDATTKSVTLSDGTSLQFQWSGTSLGIKTDEDSEYTYVDLQGIQGPVGPKGEAFTIKKTYTSVAEMNADFNNMQLGDYVMIASTVEVEDNAKLYTRGESQWIFISDFSGAQGIRGETGLTPNIQIGTVVTGQTSSVTRTGTNENPLLNFVLEKGDKGDTGNTGPTGNGIASIDKTGTSGENVDIYTITYTNGQTSTFTVTNGEVTLDEYNKLKAKVNDLELNEPINTATGTSISLTDAYNMNIVNLELSKESTQDGTPTPEEPVEIKTVTGYRNLFNKDNANIISGYVDASKKIVSYANNKLIWIECEGNTTYTVEKLNYINKSLSISFAETEPQINDIMISKQTVSNNIATVTSPANAHYLLASIYNDTDYQASKSLQEILDNYAIYQSSTELPYVPYGTNWLALTNTNGTDTNYYTIPLRENEIVGKLTNFDKLLIDIDGHCWLNKVFAKIDSYDGETITTDYISTTGGLDEGATIYYVDTPQLIDLLYDVNLRLFNGNNTITNNEIADMVIKYVVDIDDVLESKQDVLVSGTNLKTINNISLLGSGNIDIQGGGGGGYAPTIDGEKMVFTNDVRVVGEELVF